MKISEITVKDLADYMRLDDATAIELSEIERMRSSAIAFMSDYTGLTVTELDEHESLTHAFFVLVTDMFDNRNFYLEKSSSINKSVECILGMHSVNLL